MKKILSSVIAAGLVLGTTAANAAPAIERNAASVSDAEGFGGDGEGGGLLIILLLAAIAAGIVIFIEDNEDEDLPTSP